MKHALPSFRCKDCRLNTMTEYYMVHDDVWQEASMKPNGGMLCVGCIEDRLGRRLTKKDFTGVPINRFNAETYSPRLQVRLATK